MRPRGHPIPACSAWIAALASLAVAPAFAASDAGTIGIAWTAPPECPTTSDLEASIRDLLGHAPRVADGRHLEVKAHAERKPDHRWTATIETRLGTTTGTRTFATESCRAAADATALIVALMIDPEAVAAHAAPAAAPPGPTAAEQPMPATAATATVAAPAPASRWKLPVRFSIGPTIALDRGTLPQLTYGAGGRLGVKIGASTLELGVLASGQASRTVPATAPPAGGSFHFRSASFSACPAIARRGFDLGACADIQLTQVSGTGFGVTSTFENDARWLAIGGGLLARLRVTSHVAIPFRFETVTPLAHPTFFLKGFPEAQSQVYSPSRVAVRALAAVDIDF